MTEVSVTLKGGPGYDAPWIVFKGDTVDDVSKQVKAARGGVFAGVKAAAAEFQSATPATAAEAVRNIQAAMPGSEVIAVEDNEGQELGDDINPVCSKCDGTAEWREGNSPKSGPYSGWYCLTKHCANYWKPVK